MEKEIIQEWINAVNAHDPERLAALLHPSEFIWELGANSTKGRDASKEAWKLFFEAFPDFHFETERMFSSGEYVITQIVMTGTHKGPLKFSGTSSMEKPLAATNKTIKIPGCAIHKILDEKIVHLWAYWDTATMLRQIGVI